jgi:hypothetical protein
VFLIWREALEAALLCLKVAKRHLVAWMRKWEFGGEWRISFEADLCLLICNVPR